MNKELLLASLLIVSASVCRAENEIHSQASGIFDAAAAAGSVQKPVAAISNGNVSISGLESRAPSASKAPAMPQDGTPGWKKFMLNGEESSVVAGAAGWGMFAGVIGGIIIGWAANAWLGALLGFIGGGLAGAAIGAVLGYLFVKIFA